MRMLFLTHLVPYPAASGGAVVAGQTLESLARMGAVDVCAFIPWWRPVRVEQLRQVAHRCTVLPLRRRKTLYWLPLHMRGLPYYVFRDYSPEMERSVRRLLSRSYDLVIVDSLYMSPYVTNPQQPIILQEHNVEWYLVESFVRLWREPWWRLVGKLEAGALRRYEVQYCARCDAVVALSAEDRERLRQAGVRTRIEVIPPSIEVKKGRPNASGRYILHVGTGHWPPAADGIRWFLRAVFPRIQRMVPGVEFWLAGAPPADLSGTRVPDGVRVLGYVEDLEPVYQEAAVFVVPLRVGSGVRLKILHALARGLAVVSTAAGCEGLGLVDGVHGRIANSAEEFADAVVELLEHPGLRKRLGDAGQAFVREHFNHQVRQARWERLVQEIVRGGRS